MVALVLLAAPAVVAQKELPENQSSKIPASKPDESLKRTRRVSDDSRNEGLTPNHVKSPEAAEQAAAEDHDSPKDEVEVLRDEIAGAPNEQERTRLRLKHGTPGSETQLG